MKNLHKKRILDDIEVFQSKYPNHILDVECKLRSMIFAEIHKRAAYLCSINKYMAEFRMSDGRYIFVSNEGEELTEYRNKQFDNFMGKWATKHKIDYDRLWIKKESDYKINYYVQKPAGRPRKIDLK